MLVNISKLFAQCYELKRMIFFIKVFIQVFRKLDEISNISIRGFLHEDKISSNNISSGIKTYNP